jgi:two-component system sensor histidine kinase DegS
VYVARQPDALRLVIEDNGVGFDALAPRTPDRRGLGLIGMRERASHLNGTVLIDSAHGRGTRVVVELPVRRATDAGGAAYTAHTALAG